MANIKITQKRSLIGRPQNQRGIIRGLGLRKINHSVVRPDTDVIRGMIFKVKHLVVSEPTTEDISPSSRSRKKNQA